METLVETTRGKLQGERKEGVSVFRGIPFARPPVGPLRFRAPLPPSPWTGVRQATAFGHAAFQMHHPMGQLVGIDLTDVDEDCLSLNVWTPGTEGRRPVMVWFHGGGFSVGAGSERAYDGTVLARRGDVVVVTANYRLGIFGFLHGRTLCGDEFPASGNEGILDVAAALRWVREEIAAFGGDPGNITAFGQSAGGICLTGLMGMFSARELFDKAILQSGCVNLLRTPEEASVLTASVLKATGLTPATAGRLRDIPAAELQKLQDENAWLFLPVMDGEVMPRSPWHAVREGALEGTPLLIGTNIDEQTLFDAIDPSVESLDEAGLLARLEPRMPGHARRAIETYRASRAARGESTTPPALWSAILSEELRYTSMTLAELHSRRTPASYTYLFTRRTPAMGGKLGATHCIELPFVFGIDNDPSLKEFSGAEGPAALSLSERMQEAWLAFARTGAPSCPDLAWPRYEPGRRATMKLDDTCEVQDAPREEERRFWESLDPLHVSAPAPFMEQPAGETR